MTTIRVLLVDDNIEFQESATRLLLSEPEIEVVGHAMTGYEALELTNKLHPNLVLMDLAMPGMNGLEATQIIKLQPEAPCVVILSLYDTPEYREAAEISGADGFINKLDFILHFPSLIRLLLSKNGETTK